MPSSRRTVKPPTSKDVAALAGVSRTTVSFVINGKANVSDETRRRVEDAMHRLNYQPNVGARLLRTNKTGIIALFAMIHAGRDANETAPYIDAVVSEARRRDYDVLINTASPSADGIQRLISKSICDAFILLDISANDERIPVAAASQAPTVLVGRPANPMGLDVVDFDTDEAGRMAVRELAETGHHHIVMAGEPMQSDASSYRFVGDFHTGILDEARHYGIPVSVVPRVSGDWQEYLTLTDQLLEHADDRLGIILRQPHTIEWTLRLMRTRGLVPGKDVSIVAHCADSAAISYLCPISNISTRPETMSQQAAAILFDRLNGDDGPAHFDLIKPHQLTRRESTVVWNN